MYYGNGAIKVITLDGECRSYLENIENILYQTQSIKYHTNKIGCLEKNSMPE